MSSKNQLVGKHRKWLFPLITLLLTPEVAYAHTPIILIPVLASPILFIAFSLMIIFLNRFAGKRFISWLGVVIPIAIGILTAIYAPYSDLITILTLFFVFVAPIVVFLIIWHQAKN